MEIVHEDDKTFHFKNSHNNKGLHSVHLTVTHSVLFGQISRGGNYYHHWERMKLQAFSNFSQFCTENEGEGMCSGYLSLAGGVGNVRVSSGGRGREPACSKEHLVDLSSSRGLSTLSRLQVLSPVRKLPPPHPETREM